jgi:hypothetical protein
MKQRIIFNRKFWELTGCIHNHTKYSYDSKAPLEKVIKAARENDLDYFTITDHRVMKAKEDEAYKKEKEIKIIVGCEINDNDNKNHLLVFGSDRIITGSDAQYYTKEYMRENATTFVAHPIEKRACDEFATYEWTDLENSNFNGLEIWNYMSQWISKLKIKRNGLFLVLMPNLVVRKPFKEILEYWDKLNIAGLRKSAIGSVDAHEQQHKVFGINIRFLGHKFLFKTIRTNILIPNDKDVTKENIINALANGNSYIVNYRCGIPYNFYAGISDKKNEAIFGEEIKFNEDLKLYYRLPAICKVKLICNGEVVDSQKDDKGIFKIKSAGNYRLEIYKNWRGWIYTNNIYVY